MIKQFGIVKRFKKELIDDLMKDNVQENSLGQEFKEPMDEDGIKIMDGNQEKVLEIHKREKIVVSNNEEDMGPIEQKQSSTCIQQISTKVFVEDDLKDKFFQSLEVKVQKKNLFYR